MAWSDNLFYIAFLSQILLMSWYFPTRLLGRMQRVLENYPPQTYPKLYPRPVEIYRMGMGLFKYVSRFILLLGFVILLAIIFWVDHSAFADDGFISEAWPAAYGMIQFLPLIAIEFSEFGHFKQMRKAHSSSKRVADLRRRGFADLVSPSLLGIALLMLVGAIVFDLYVHDFDVTPGHDTVQRAFVLIATNALMAAVGAWSLFGRKFNPHESAEDRMRRVSVSLKSLLLVSMALSLFIAIAAADDVFSLDAVDATVMSIYFQVCAVLSLGFMLRNIKLEEIDFDVYKNDATAA